MTNSIAPVWDGNETWLVLGGGGLMAVFPLAYATVLPALYVPIILMLLGLIFRGVAFEFRFRTVRWRGVWDWGFAIGSTVAALMQGIALGALVQGISITDRTYSGGWWDWLTPFSVLTGLAVVIGYALLGATWLNLKTGGELQARAKRLSLIAFIGTLGLIGVVSLWTPFLDPIYFERWFGWPTAFFSAFVPLLLAVCAFALWYGLRHNHNLTPFLAALGLFVLSYVGIGISFYPYIVPGALTIAEAAAPDASLSFLLVGAVILIPIILAYTGYAYWVFRGKVDPEEGYH
jgi:cytochrome d ubiquinol oxidase subunit II